MLPGRAPSPCRAALTCDIVDLTMAVMLQSIAAAAASAAATVLGASHAHEAASHRQLGGLGEVGQDAPCGVGETSLHGGLRLRSLKMTGHMSRLWRVCSRFKLQKSSVQAKAALYLAEGVMSNHAVSLGGIGAGGG